MTRLKWNNRQAPTDLDDNPDTLPSYEFDYRRSSTPGTPSWPERHGREKFGPAIIKKAWKAGLVVVAEVEGFPYPVAAQEVRWGAAGVLEVKTLEGYRVPERLYTRSDAHGLTSTGILIEKEQSNEHS